MFDYLMESMLGEDYIEEEMKTAADFVHKYNDMARKHYGDEYHIANRTANKLDASVDGKHRSRHPLEYEKIAIKAKSLDKNNNNDRNRRESEMQHAADALDRHNRRHPDSKIESAELDEFEEEF